jgi:hypothetical protein
MSALLGVISCDSQENKAKEPPNIINIGRLICGLLYWRQLI